MDANELYTSIREKALQALETVLADRELGVISTSEARVAIAALFNATAGLAGRDFYELISEASAQIGREEDRFSVLRRIFVAPTGALVSLEYQYGDAKVSVKTSSFNDPFFKEGGWTSVSHKSFENETVPSVAALKRYDEYVESLLRQGYKELT